MCSMFSIRNIFVEFVERCVFFECFSLEKLLFEHWNMMMIMNIHSLAFAHIPIYTDVNVFRSCKWYVYRCHCGCCEMRVNIRCQIYVFKKKKNCLNIFTIFGLSTILTFDIGQIWCSFATKQQQKKTH